MRSGMVIYLISYTVKPGPFSDDWEKKPIRRKIYANEHGASLGLSLKARIDGLRISGQAEILTYEYKGEEEVEVDGKIDTILNVQTKGDKTILTYGRALGNANQSG